MPHRHRSELQEVPAFSFCPLKTVLGDYMKEEKSPTKKPEEKR